MSRRSLAVLGIFGIAAVAVGANSMGGFSGAGHEMARVSTAAASQEAAAVYAFVPSEPVTLITEPDDGISPILNRINSATSSIDLVMYELHDKTTEKALAAAAGRGVAVRVMLDDGEYGTGSSANASAYSYLASHGVAVHWSPSSFALTHQKTLITDASDALIMTLNLSSQYYATSRDFAIDDPDARDVSAIERVFDADWNDGPIEESTGDDLVWSPGSKSELLAMINAAKSSLLIYNEELQDPDIIHAIAAAAGRGVAVRLLMTDEPEWHDAFSQIISAGGEVRTYASDASLYIHAKVLVADGAQAFIGSENLSTASLENNRELGILVSNPTIIAQIRDVFQKDWNGADTSMEY